MEIVGRRAALDRIAELGAAREGALLVVGDEGMGKSRVLEAAHNALGSGVLSSLLRVSPAEAELPLAGFSALMSLFRDPRAVEIGERFAMRPTEPSQLFADAREVLTALRGMSLPPQLLLIDDVDRMDAESQLLIGFMARRVTNTEITFIGSASGIDPSGPFAGLPVVQLEPLDSESLVKIADHASPGSFDEGSLAILSSYADGNPRALLEILDGVNRKEARGETALSLPPLPRGAARAQHSATIGNLGNPQTLVLERLSAAPITPRTTAIRGGPVEEDALQKLIYRGLVESLGPDVRVASQLVRSSVYWSLNSRKRYDLHHAEAEAPGRPYSFWHASFGEPNDKLPQHLLASATAHARDGAVTAATEYADRALLLAEEGQLALDSIVPFAHTLMLRGELSLASRYAIFGLRRASTTTARMRLTGLMTEIEFMGRLRATEGDPAISTSAIARAAPRRTFQLMTEAALWRTLRWETDDAEQLLIRARDLAPVGASHALAEHDEVMRLLAATKGTTADDRGPESEQVRTTPVTSWLIAARTRTLREDYQGARRLCAMILDQRPTADPIWVDLARFVLAKNELQAGNYSAARIALWEWKMLVTTKSQPEFHLFADAWFAYLDGRPQDASAVIEQGLAAAPLDRNPALTTSLLTLKAELAMIAGDPDEAIRNLAPLEFAIDNPALSRHVPDLAEALQLTGRGRELGALVGRFTERCRSYPSHWAQVALARVAAIAADDDHAVDLFDSALVACGPRGSRVEIGRILAAKASRLGALGDGAGRRENLAAARDAFGSGGAPDWEKRMTHLLSHSDDGDRAGAGGTGGTAFQRLTAEELRIATLVLSGFRNKEIASQLFVSVRTVELRLTHIYRTVGARSRSHLASLMSAPSGPPLGRPAAGGISRRS